MSSPHVPQEEVKNYNHMILKSWHVYVLLFVQKQMMQTVFTA